MAEQLGVSAGEPMIIKKAVCMHEEDYGTLWKHTEYRTGHSEVRRSRRLVLSFISTIANYEYGFYWYFYQVSHALMPTASLGNVGVLTWTPQRYVYAHAQQANCILGMGLL